MKYLVYTIVVFFLALIQSSFVSGLRFIFPEINFLIVILFSYYISRKSTLALYLLVVGGVFLDFFVSGHIGVTSTNISIMLIVYFFLSQVFPKERFGDVISITISFLIFYLLSLVTNNLIYSHSMNGFVSIIIPVVINSILTIILAFGLEIIHPAKKETKIKI